MWAVLLALALRGARSSIDTSTLLQPKPAAPPPPLLLAATEPPTLEPRANVLPLAVLMLVPVAWGTYGVAIKSLYELEAPPPELLFTLLNYLVSSTSVYAVSLLASSAPRTDGAAAADAGAPLPLREGLELGAYLFLGSTLQIFGLRDTSASRGAFIVQLSTVLTPLLEGALARQWPARRVLAGCAVAFLGVALLVTEGGAGASSSLKGDLLIAASAVAYSLHVVRLSVHAPRLAPIQLARAKEVSRLGLASGVLAVGLAVSSTQASEAAAFCRAMASGGDAPLHAAAILLWTGVVTTAFTTWGQSFGQAVVSASTASVVYTLQPVWSSVFASWLLGESFGPQACVGAVLILGALVLVVSLQGPEPPDSELRREDRVR